MVALNLFLAGAGTLAAWVIALFFLRFWRRTGDSLFIYFALSFAIEGALRAYMALTGAGADTGANVYFLRLLSYGLIVVGIVGKNRRSRRQGLRAQHGQAR
jgi:hypothetical protein